MPRGSPADVATDAFSSLTIRRGRFFRLARSQGSNEMSLKSNRRQFLLGAAASSLAITAAGGIGRAFAQEQQLVFWSQLAGSKKAAGEALEAAFKTAHPEIALNSSLFAEPSQLNE